MKKLTWILPIVFSFSLMGCSTTQKVSLAKLNAPKAIASVAQVPEEGNSPDMNAKLDSALRAEGLNVKQPLAQGTRTSGDVDAIVSYTDSWRWDIVMYLKSLTVRMYDAATGDLLVSGEWSDSALHGFRDSQAVVKGVVSEMLAKLKSGSAP
jgi:hypothetical protein